MNRNEAEGKVEAIKGKAKQAVGRLANDPVLEDEGVQDETAGKTQEAIGRTQRKVGEAVQRVGKKIKG